MMDALHLEGADRRERPVLLGRDRGVDPFHTAVLRLQAADAHGQGGSRARVNQAFGPRGEATMKAWKEKVGLGQYRLVVARKDG